MLFDKAYVDFAHLHQLDQRGVWWVTRAKDNLQYRVVKRHLKKPAGKILRDDEIVLTGTLSHGRYPTRLRRVVARVEVEGGEREMEFLTSNFDWAARSVAEFYRARWPIEVFFQAESSRRCNWRTSWATAPKRRALASVDGVAGLCPVALPGLSESVGQQFCPVVGGGAFGVVVEAGPGGVAGKLWDSRWRLPDAGPTRTGVFAGISSHGYGIATVPEGPENLAMN